MQATTENIKILTAQYVATYNAWQAEYYRVYEAIGPHGDEQARIASADAYKIYAKAREALMEAMK